MNKKAFIPIGILLLLVIIAVTGKTLLNKQTPDTAPVSESAAISFLESGREKPEDSKPPESKTDPETKPLAWLKFPGTAIDGEVMQAADNDYYLRRDEKGEENPWGCYYADFECGANSRNFIIYGHSSLDDSAEGDKFSALKKLNNPDFAKTNSTINVTINGQQFNYKVFSVGLANDLTDGIAITANPDAETMQRIIDMAKERSLYDFGIDASPDDMLLTLSTCTSDENTRYLVVAKRIV